MKIELVLKKSKFSIFKNKISLFKMAIHSTNFREYSYHKCYLNKIIFGKKVLIYNDAYYKLFY